MEEEEEPGGLAGDGKNLEQWTYGADVGDADVAAAGDAAAAAAGAGGKRHQKCLQQRQNTCHDGLESRRDERDPFSMDAKSQFAGFNEWIEEGETADSQSLEPGPEPERTRLRNGGRGGWRIEN